jgi:hypothetical protein
MQINSASKAAQEKPLFPSRSFSTAWVDAQIPV